MALMIMRAQGRAVTFLLYDEPTALSGHARPFPLFANPPHFADLRDCSGAIPSNRRISLYANDEIFIEC